MQRFRALRVVQRAVEGAPQVRLMRPSLSKQYMQFCEMGSLVATPLVYGGATDAAPTSVHQAFRPDFDMFRETRSENINVISRQINIQQMME